MGISDTPPADTSRWIIPLHTALLGIGVLLWDATYILMTRRALATKSFGMPLVALAANLSWEVIYVFYVCEVPLETFGFLFWLILDIGLVYTTLRFGAEDGKHTWPWVGRNIAWVLGFLTLLGGVAQYVLAAAWLAEPHVGSGLKNGKWWKGREG
jgi:hypothetical protein